MCLVVREVRLVRKELARVWDGAGVSAPSLELSGLSEIVCLYASRRFVTF